MRKVNVLLSLLLLLHQCGNKKATIVFEDVTADNPTGLWQPKEYVLKKKSIDSDFNYTKLDHIDFYNKIKSFDPVSGQFTYYQFIATYYGNAYVPPGDDGANIKVFHDILIVKTNMLNKMLDAYQYTLEWAETPCQHDVYKSTPVNVVLKNNLNIKLLNLSRTDYWDENDKMLNEDGFIKLK